MKPNAGPSVPRWLLRAHLRYDFLAHYDRDEEFTGELNAVYERHGDDLRASPTPYRLQDYEGFARDAATLARRFGLDRLAEGSELIERWCWHRVRWESNGHRLPMPLTSVASAGGAAGEPEVATELTLRWDPSAEAQKDARHRLRREALAAVDQTMVAGEVAVPTQGHVFLHQRPELERDMTFLYWRVRHGWDWSRICKEWDAKHGTRLGAEAKEDAMEKQARRLSKLMGLDAQGLNASERREGHR